MQTIHINKDLDCKMGDFTAFMWDYVQGFISNVKIEHEAGEIVKQKIEVTPRITREMSEPDTYREANGYLIHQKLGRVLNNHGVTEEELQREYSKLSKDDKLLREYCAN